MQVKKFEAPTIQEALDNVKRELGPEAIILQTKNNKKGFGLLSKASVEVTAAISEKSLQRKQMVESRISESSKNAIKALSSDKQAKIMEKYLERLTPSQKQGENLSKEKMATKKITATRYIDIEDSLNERKGEGSHERLQGSLLRNRTGNIGRNIAGNIDENLAGNHIDKLELSKRGIHERSKAEPKVETQSHSLEQYSHSNELSLRPKTSDGSRSHDYLLLEEEVRKLKSTIEDLKIAREASVGAKIQGDSLLSDLSIRAPELLEAFDQLILNGIDRRYAYSLIKTIGFELENRLEGAEKSEIVLDCLASELMRSVEVQGIFQEKEWEPTLETKKPRVIALVGPTGVGKTSTLAKLANEAITKRNFKIGLINLDQFKPGAFDQLGTYAKILNVPFRFSSCSDDFRTALNDFKNFDVILVDTGGVSQRNSEALQTTIELLQSVPEMGVYIVLSATMRDIELCNIVNSLSALRPKGLIFSKLDEASIYGSIYNISQKVKLPLSYFTTGQRIPEDIELATKERVVSLVMDL